MMVHNFVTKFISAPGNHLRNSFIQFDIVDLGASTICGPDASLYSVRYLVDKWLSFTRACQVINYSSDLPNHRDCLNSLAETHFICKDATDSIVVQPYLQVKLACISRQYNTQGDTSQFSPSS
jgi:hypothetical protein